MLVTRRNACAAALVGAAATVMRPTMGQAAPSTRRLNTATARSVRGFLSSVGVGTHWTYTDTPYGYAFERVRDALVASGIRRVRSDLFSDRLVDLARHGITSTVGVGPENGPLQGVIRRIKELNAHTKTVVAVEGPNEPDVFWARMKITYQGQGFPAGTRAFVRDLYHALKADPATRDLPVIGPSLGRTYGTTPNPFARGELADVVDWGNFHPYPGGNPFSYPEPYAGIARYYWESDFPAVNMDEHPFAREVYAPPFAPKPMAATETGYSTTVGGTSEEVHAIYVPRLFCEYFRQHVIRTYLYEFIDEFDDPGGNDREAHFGLLRRDLSPKPAYKALQSLLALLRKAPAETGHQAGLVPVELRVSPNGTYTRTDYVHDLLLSAGDGIFYLLLWHEVAAEDISKTPYRRVRPAALPTRITFGRPMASVQHYGYDTQWNLRRTFAGEGTRSVDVDVGETVSVLVFR